MSNRALVAALALALAAPAHAAVDYFLKIDGIPGESTDDKHKNEIQIESFSWGAAQASQGSARSARGCAQEFHFTKMLDKASPLLASNAVSGMVIPNAILIGRKAGDRPVEYLKYELKNVMVTSYQTAGSSSSSLPIDSFSLNFASLSIEYKTQNQDGTVGDPVRVPIAGTC